MKKVLVFGKGSYIGDSLARYAQGRLDITFTDARGDAWKRLDYSLFDSVVFVAGIAHQKQTKDNKDLYFAINRDLAAAVAQKAKDDGVGQFVYLSSMSVYGVKSGEITENTIPFPFANDYYGQSKLQAEKLLTGVSGDGFRVAVIRPPMVYGYGCKGKFQSLIKVAGKLPVLPTLVNKRSMINIDNLTELLTIVVEQGVFGVLCPQDREYINTSDMLAAVVKAANKPCRPFPLLNLLIRAALPISSSLQTAFGSLYYSPGASKMPFEQEYQVLGGAEAVSKSINPDGAM